MPEPVSASVASETEWQGGGLENAAFRLVLAPRDGLRKTQIVHLPSRVAVADGNYCYSFGRPEFKEIELNKSGDGSPSLSLRGAIPDTSLEILHRFYLPHDQPWLEEQITLTNRGSQPVDLSDGRCGFLLSLPLSGGQLAGRWSEFKLTAIPFRRDPGGHRTQYADFTLAQVLTEPYSFEPLGAETIVTPAYAAEGWAWTDGKEGFLITKYGQQGMEWSLLDRVNLPNQGIALRWGGYGIYRGEPAHGAWLLPGESHQFGVTRLTAYTGSLTEGYYAFRDEMAARGHGCPQEFDAPVHWNELYDNKLWWLPGEQQGDPEMRKKYYRLDDMKAEAAKAKAIGCEALYMDPGWDTSFASKIWDETRLGPYKTFTEMLQREYGLKSSLHTPLSGWCDPSSYPLEACRVDRFGQRLTWNKGAGFGASPLCGASRQYIEETAKRLKLLARDGATFFMFDGDNYHGECWDREHGHVVPARREEHVHACCRLARMVHAEYPRVLIEMHGPNPIYYGHGLATGDGDLSTASGFDSVWAFELMWMPMDDLLSRRSLALYYYSLAYSLPLYIHIDLRTDNANALVFWWNASTCRHLGIGGTHVDRQVQRAHKEAMATYRRLKPFFASGTFYGIDEMVHVHRHPTASAAVINCFNLEGQAAVRTIELELGRFGLDPAKKYRVIGAPYRRSDDRYTLDVSIPSQGHVLVEVV
jgi:hypothetical protein